MHVTLVGSGAGIGGTERHLASLLGQLPGRGLEVELITSEEGPLTTFAASCGVRVTILPRVRRRAYLWDLILHFRRTRPDVVHAHSGRLPCLAARLARVPWVLDTRHGHLVVESGPAEDQRTAAEPSAPPTRWGWRLEGLKGRLAHLTLTVCENDAAPLVEHGGLPRARVRTVYNGVPLVAAAARHLPVRDPHLLGWIGRMTPQKAPGRVLDLFAGLIASLGAHGHPAQIRLEMVGEGPLRSELEAQSRRLGIEERVSFPGASTEPLRAMGRYRLLLVPSRREGLPYVLLEALSVGTPVLATPVGGVGEVLIGELAGSLRPWDLDSWVRGAHDLVTDDDLWTRFHVASLAASRRFSEEEMVERILGIYGEGCGSKS